MSFAPSIFRSGIFSGLNAIVTGGGTGIGKAITYELLSLGCNVTIASRSEPKLHQATNELTEAIQHIEHAGSVRYTVCNIRKEDEVQRLMKDSLREYPSIDILINNGGGQFPSKAENISLKGWNAVVDTNLTGTFLMCREVYKASMKHHGGSICNIIVDMFKGWPGMSHTAAARAGVDNLTKSLAVEWASSGVRVNSVAPGFIFNETAEQHYDDPSLLTSFVPHIPAKRLGTVEEVSAAVCFLSSPAAAYITGSTLKVDGGVALRSNTWCIPHHTNSKAFGNLPDRAFSKPDNK